MYKDIGHSHEVVSRSRYIGRMRAVTGHTLVKPDMWTNWTYSTMYKLSVVHKRSRCNISTPATNLHPNFALSPAINATNPASKLRFITLRTLTILRSRAIIFTQTPLYCAAANLHSIFTRCALSRQMFALLRRAVKLSAQLRKLRSRYDYATWSIPNLVSLILDFWTNISK